MEDNIYKIIARELAGETNEEEIRQLNDWIKKKNNRLIYYSIRQDLYNIKSNSDKSQKDVFLRIVNRISKNTGINNNQSKPAYMLSNWWKVAAVLLVSIGVSWFMLRKDDIKEQPVTHNVEIIKSNPNGRKSSIVLSDGTLVKLNSASRLTYSENFNENFREVFLEGEAFFDVKKDIKRPFIVRTGELSTTALGTSFNVKAYLNENPIKISLVSGKVKVERQSESVDYMSEIILNPSEMASFDRQSLKISKSAFNYDMELAWKNYTLYFKNAGMKNMIKRLERWYGVDFLMENDLVISTRFTGKFQDKNLEYVLNVISNDQEDFSFTINGKKINVFKN